MEVALDLLKEVEMRAEMKVPLSPMPEELYIPKQLRKGDYFCKLMAKILYGNLY